MTGFLKEKDSSASNSNVSQDEIEEFLYYLAFQNKVLKDYIDTFLFTLDLKD